ncbi:MAG TPA: hypothetical protein VMG12_31195 [Polyangiaceae bacterium]|nr:hypothetical protein [Polyangiaceae bacterium]
MTRSIPSRLPAFLSHLLGCYLVAATGCSAEEAARVNLPVQVDARDLEPVDSDWGYTVELSEARLVVTDLKFAVGGEAHASNGWRRLSDWLVPVAHAHPGHFEGGDVTGELLGSFVTSWLPVASAPIGVATLLEGDYRSASFAFGLGSIDQGLAADDPLIGHTALLRGSATRGSERRDFLLLLDAAAGQELVGMPFDAGVRASEPFAIGFELLSTDPISQSTLFDNIDFGRLPVADDGLVHIVDGSGDAAIATAYERVSLAFHGASHFRMSSVPLD